MSNFTKLNNYLGWGVFAIAFVTYALTMERTASFWDCGEFIACAYKLQVPHPPGAPLFLLIGRLFSLLAGSDKTQVAYWVNMSSVVASAFTILFMFWTIVLIGRKVINKKFEELTQGEAISLLGAGLVGSLAYTFSDTFWFSAVEAEVYAMSSFFTALVVWAAFKWELIEDEAAANRWLIFIAYIVGLSIGVHLLNLVTIPALTLLYYFKKSPKPTYLKGLTAILIGLLVIGIINVGIIPGLPTMAFTFEKLFVNTFGLPYGSGAVFFVILLVSLLVFGIRLSVRKQKVTLNVALLSLVFVLIGYFSYTLALVRSNHNPPINENNPSNLLNFIKYLKREQYGYNNALLYGPVYSSQIEAFEQGDEVYTMKNGKYVVYDHRPKYIYPKDQKMLFPRMQRYLPGDTKFYQEAMGIPQGQNPTFADNLKYFFGHQVGMMYMRYLFWNFMGRESDIQDAPALSPFQYNGKLPEALANNKARNNYYCLPLLLGILGFILLFRKNRKDLLVILLMFIMTGLALVVFLNVPPTQPRERDYIYVGSFYFFAIWIGLGVIQLSEILAKFKLNANLKTSIATAFSLVIPLILLQQNWDDHNRNHRYQQVDFAKNILDSCAKDAILFTAGDNDTFPLWYAQEVEGFRTDVRICVLTYLGTDWDIEQKRRKVYDSDALPIKIDKDKLLEGINDQILYYENPNVKNGINLSEYLKLVREDNPAIKVQLQTGEMINTLPSSNLFLPVNVAAVKKQGFIPKQLEPLLTDTISWDFGKRDLLKNDLIQLEIIANNAADNWKRPIYFSSTLAAESFLGLKEFMQEEGFAYRLMPFKIQGAVDGFVNTDIMYKNMMTKMSWRELNNPQVYYQSDFYQMPFIISRLAFLRLADQLVREGKKNEAKLAMDRCMTVMPNDTVPYDQLSASFVGLYASVGETKKALAIADVMMNRNDKALDYYLEGKPDRNAREIQLALYEMQIITNQLKEMKVPGAARYEAMFQKQLQRVNS